MSKIVYLTHRTRFCAAHRLHNPNLSDEDNKRIYDKCNNPNGHGHNYVLFVTLKGTPDPNTGMLTNFTNVKKIVNDTIHDPMDHKHLNLDVPEFKHVIPTAENMLIVFWDLLVNQFPKGQLYELKLEETENNYCTYRGESESE